MDFLNKFKYKLADTQKYFNEEQNDLCNQQMQQLDFKVQVGPKTRRGLLVRLTFKGKIQLVMRVQSRYKVKSFSLDWSHGSEAIGAEGNTGKNVFEYLTNSVCKIYQVYESISDFPLGLLIILVYTHSMVLFEEKCKACERQFDFSAKGFGLLVP